MAHYTAKNWGGRHENEDRWVTNHDRFAHDGSHPDFFTVGVLDGHDTEAASDTVSNMLPGVLGRLLKDRKLPVEQAYVEAMEEIEGHLKKVISTAGTCVLSCTIAGRFVWCSNLGDCRAALLALKEPDLPASGSAAPSPPKAEQLYWLSRDLKASAPYERDRIRLAGGTVIDGRVEGLEPSRTLGDFDVKMQVKPGVISIVPEVRRHELGNGHTTSQAILVMATDGCWDVLSSQDVCDLVHARKELSALQVHEAAAASAGQRSETRGPERRPGGRVLWDLAEDLVQFSIARGSRDDCTAVVALITVSPPRGSRAL